MKKTLYLPSTPLNILITLAHSAAFKTEQTAYLVLIDQRITEKDNLYFKLLKQQTDLFEKVILLEGRAKGLGKLQERQKNFDALDNLLFSFIPNRVLVGSDRRVEFQYIMHRLQQLSIEAEGVYLDDGLYSYAGKPYSPFKEPINALLKKWAYGRWWDEPATIGASKWVSEAWLFEPEKAVAELFKKTRYKIESNWFISEPVKKFGQALLRDYGISKAELSELAEVDLFLSFSHPNDIARMHGYQKGVEAFLEDAKQQGKNVAVKYHPRANSDDDWQLSQRFGCWLAPRTLAFEFLLPFLKPQSVVVGDVGTVVMTAKWLRSDVHSIAVLNPNDNSAKQFIPIMKKLDIPLIASLKEVLKF